MPTLSCCDLTAAVYLQPSRGNPTALFGRSANVLQTGNKLYAQNRASPFNARFVLPIRWC
jgi:hypothetical protein